jgi:methionyl aminopeptidase
MMKPLTKGQIVYAKKSGAITGFVLNEIGGFIKPGITTNEIEKLARKIITSKGGVPAFIGCNGYEFATCVSVNDEIVHTKPSKRIIKEGDIVSCDVGTCYRGINTDAAQTYIVGESTEDVKRLVEGTRQALLDAIGKVKPGHKIGDIEQKTGEILKKYGLFPVMTLSGHGIGEQVHQEPSIMCDGQEGTGPDIVESTMLAIEPMATLGDSQLATADGNWTVKTVDGSWGAHFEHTVLVTHKGCEILTVSR